MDLDARGISYAAYSAAGEKLLPLPRPARVLSSSCKTAEMGARGVSEVLQRAEGWLWEGGTRRDGEHCSERRLLASSLCREGRGMRAGPQPASTLPPQNAQRTHLKWLVSGNEDSWHLSTMNYLGGPMKQAVLHRLLWRVTPYTVGYATRGNKQ